MRVKQFVLLLPVIFTSALYGAISTSDQYAYQAELSSADQPLQRVELPLDILLTATRADLGDVAVFDASGKPLPGWIRKVAIPKSQKQFGLPIYLFNTYQQGRSKTLTRRDQFQDQNQLFESTTSETVPIDRARQDYIIGLPEADENLQIESIELVWTHQPEDQLLQLKIEVGSDLDNWRTIQDNKSLTNQKTEDVKWRTIEAIPGGEKYLRLTPVNSTLSFELKQAIGTYNEKQAERKIWHQLGTLRISSTAQNHLELDMPFAVRALELKLIPAEQQTLISGDLFASQVGFEQKRLISHNFQQHNITATAIEPSNPVKLPRQNYIHWWFRPTQDSISAPLAEIAFPVYELLFLGNDNGPFTLAWGNYESLAPPNQLIGILNTEQQRQPAGELVQLHSIEIAGGKSRLSPREKLPWLKWLLWALLVGTVITAGKMTISLYRDMNTA